MKYILGVLAVVIVLFATIFWIITSGPDDSEAVQENAVVELIDYADSGASVTYNISGPIVGEEEHRQVRITVNRNQRIFELISGYNGKVLQRETFTNTRDAFEEFVYAIDLAGFADEKDADFESIKGVCPNGRRTEYTLSDQGDDIARLWSTSCDKDDGSFAGDRNLVKNLFEDQILEYRAITRGVRL